MDALEFRCKGKGINFLKHKKAKNKKAQHLGWCCTLKQLLNG